MKRVLVITHLGRRNETLGSGTYCQPCAFRITGQSRREYGTPRVIANSHIYDLPDGTRERHTWATVAQDTPCCGSECVQGVPERRGAA